MKITDGFTDVRYDGVSYEALIPDTLDLAERACIAVNGLGGVIDPAVSHTSCFSVDYMMKTPAMVHGGADILCDPKIMESLMLMRIMSGSRQHMELEETQRNELVSRIRDGLYWNYADEARPWRASYSPMYGYRNKDGRTEDLCPVYGAGRMMRALALLYETNRDPLAEAKIRELAAGLSGIAIYKDDYCYFPDGGYGEPFNYPRSGWLDTDEAKSEVEGGEGAVTAFQAVVVYALVKWYNLSGDAKALEFAGRIAKYCMLPKFWGGMLYYEGDFYEGSGSSGLDGGNEGGRKTRKVPDPLGIAGHELGHWYTHFHTRAVTLRAILEYGIATGNWRMKEFVRRAYEFTLTNGIARIGWISSGPNPFGDNIMEGCNLGDIAALAIRLSDAGMGDYWDDVDALARNQMAEGQLTDAGLLQKVSEAYTDEHTAERMKVLISGTPSRVIAENVIERSLGLFAAWIKPASIPVLFSAACCNGNAIQGLYYVWEGIAREQGDHTQINLLLNRAAKSVDISSYLPYEGKVSIHNKNASKISVRIPAWVDRKELSVTVNSKEASYTGMGNYILLMDLKHGDEIVIEFCIHESEASYTAAYRTKDETTYKCVFRGSTLVDITPRDDRPASYPLYLRSHLRGCGKAPMKKKEIFIPDKTILGW